MAAISPPLLLLRRAVTAPTAAAAATVRRVHTAGEHYKVLGLTRSASPAEIKAAYIRLSKELHPDVNVTKSAAEQAKKKELFLRVSEAFKVLSNPLARKEYDAAEIFGAGGAAGVRAWTAEDAKAYDKAYGFYSGTFTGVSPYKIFSNGTIIAIICTLMLCSTAWHLFAGREVKRIVEADAQNTSRETSVLYAEVKERARRNTVEEQLRLLHERNAGKKV
eukprot:m.53936 g.53936  ORF g.53936 m.53936 type:complete len:220 (+) comp13207_c0_seq1:118-777(+)